MSVVTLGIDPGVTGALAWLDSDGQIIDIVDMPIMTTTIGKTNRKAVNPQQLADLILSNPVTHAWVEQVAARPGQGVTSMFGFGRSLGLIEGTLATRGVPYTFVTPRLWAKTTGTGTGKDASRARACQLWPDHTHTFARVKDDGRAEAALIAHHGHHHQRKGTP